MTTRNRQSSHYPTVSPHWQHITADDLDSYSYLYGECISLKQRTLTGPAWHQLGSLLAKNKRLRELDLRETQMSVAGLRSLMKGGLKDVFSLARLYLDGNVNILRLRGGIELVSSYLHNDKCSITTLCLWGMNIGDAGLVNLLPLLNGTRIEKLYLGGNQIGSSRDKVRVKKNLTFAFSNLHMPHLTVLYLGGNSLGKVGCEALAHLLQNDDSKLKELSVFENDLDNECVTILADALKKNNTLKYMNLERNPGCSQQSANHFLRLVYNTTNLESVLESNHTLSRIVLDEDHKSLKNILLINERKDVSSDMRGGKKLAKYFFEGAYDMRPFLNLDVKLMPQLMAYMSTISFRAFHRLVRNMNCDATFGYPSARVQGLQSIVNRLMAENTGLKRKIESLEDQNSRLSKVAKSN